MRVPGPGEALTFARLGLPALRELARAGALRPLPPQRLLRVIGSTRSLGTSLAAGCALSAARDPDAIGLIDERGGLTYSELQDRGASIAAALADRGLGQGGALAVMCRNHRGFVEAMLAAPHVGADLLLLNTDFPGAQLAEVLEREPIAVSLLDAEFEPAFDAAGYDGPRVTAWEDDGSEELESLAEAGLDPPQGGAGGGRVVILSSGTTGTPKGAPREPSIGAFLGPMTSVLERLRIRTGDPMLVGPPLFHGFGLAYLGLAVFLGCPLVVRRRFDPEAVLAAVAEHRVACLAAVPVMLDRILHLDPEVRERHDSSSLRAVAAAGAPLPPALASDFMDAFGEVLFNLYGTTETGFAAIAGPEDLHAAPGTVGRPPRGTTLRILDDEREELGPDEVGHVFMGGELVFEGYTGGGGKEVVDGMMNTGDLGHLDREGRLFIDGREDDMIVSGGENVFPQEVADALADHEGVADVAVLGVDDEQFGQRLRAYVVAAEGAEPGEEELVAHLRDRVARFKLPREVVFVDEIPRNPTGKVLQGQLEEASSPRR